MAKNKVLVLGVGNPYRRDDGIGNEVIKVLSEQKISGFDLKDVGDGLSILEIIEPYQKVIIIDACEMAESPGTVKVFSPEEAIIKIKNDALSTHGIGLAEVLHLIKALEIKIDLKIIGVQPKEIGFGEGLSKIIKKKIPVILAYLSTGNL
jgi:hydrogenase maturation protease